MTTETKTLQVTAYRDDEGKPCCAKDFTKGEVCIFYRTISFGCAETCVFAKDFRKSPEILDRRKGGNGTLIPLKQCPIWK